MLSKTQVIHVDSEDQREGADKIIQVNSKARNIKFLIEETHNFFTPWEQ